MGTREMLPRSDLDLVPVKAGPWILPDDPERSAAVETALVRRLLDGLTAVTRHGALYPVDLRLKPYGTAGPLLVPADSLGAYFRDRADSWERVAWLKARPVAGDASLGATAVRDARAAIFSKGLDGADLARLEELRGRLAEAERSLEGSVKFSRGGLMTADLLLLAAQARARLDAGPLPRPELLKRLVEAGALPDGGSPEIASAVRFQEALLVRLRLKFLRAPDRRRASEVLAALDEEGTAGLLGGGFGAAPSGALPLAEHWEHHRGVLKEAWDRFRGG
jgi:glutamate-ammonia-ligase adenylyltransferase